jgi:hypothetical protein
MNRRDFIGTSLAAGVGALEMGAGVGHAQTPAGAQQYYELRRYELRVGKMTDRMHDYLRNAAIPAFRRAGTGPVGAFTPRFGPDSPSVFLLIPFNSIQDFAALGERLAKDSEYQKAAATQVELPATDPPYVRIESQLSVAAPFMSKLEVPAAAAGNKPRIFELRTYEAHSARARRAKLEMFGPLGELAIFRRTGLTPVFFANNLIGRRLPSFTYMLVFDDMDAREKNWTTFIDDPEWKTLRAKPGYTDPEIVSNINAQVLGPTAYSQI